MIDDTSTSRRGITLSRSHCRHDSAGNPQAIAASLTFPQDIRCLTSASRAPNVPSFGVHPVEVCSACDVVIVKG
jgi:hypothetical protein